MMKFRTELSPPEYPFTIMPDDALLFLGSCFSDHIGNYFEERRFAASVNPFGILFNPVSIANALQLALNPSTFSATMTDYYNDRWVSYAHHGKFSHPDKDYFLNRIRQQLNDTHHFLEKTSFLFITFGTAYCYEIKNSGYVVANCHKMPADHFNKVRWSVEKIVALYEQLIIELQAFNPAMQLIFTVSPVRHLGDGFHENQLSKSILHLAVDQLLHHPRCHYFPVYEWMQDDLRDYRFYDRDLCHPGSSGIAYIQEMVQASFFSKSTMESIIMIEKENKFLNHQPIKNE